jgi:hypothetical protein
MLTARVGLVRFIGLIACGHRAVALEHLSFANKRSSEDR